MSSGCWFWYTECIPIYLIVYLSATGTRGSFTIPHSMASISEKSLIVHGNRVPSAYPDPRRKKGVADRSTIRLTPSFRLATSSPVIQSQGSFHLAKKRPNIVEFVMSPMLKQPGGFGCHFPIVWLGQTSPLLHLTAKIIDNRGGRIAVQGLKAPRLHRTPILDQTWFAASWNDSSLSRDSAWERYIKFK